MILKIKFPPNPNIQYLQMIKNPEIIKNMFKYEFTIGQRSEITEISSKNIQKCEN